MWTTALLVLASAVAGSAQTSGGLSIEPTMVRGPAGAPVTIVEFSDYQ